jgi:hypothetical protein
MKRAIYSIDVKRENNYKGNKMFTHFNERVGKRDKIKCPTTKSCVEVILKDYQMPLPTKY